MPRTRHPKKGTTRQPDVGRGARWPGEVASPEHTRARGQEQSGESDDDDQQASAKRVGSDDPADPLMPAARAVVQALYCVRIKARAKALQIPGFPTYVCAVAVVPNYKRRR